MDTDRMRYSHVLLAVLVAVSCILTCGCPSKSKDAPVGDILPPGVIGAMFVGADPGSPAQGDLIKVFFDEQIAVGTVSGSTFALLPSGSFGTGATFAADPNSAATVVITLGASPSLTITGVFDPASPGAGPTGIDVAADLSVGAIDDLADNPAAQRTPDPGVDIKSKFVPDGSAVTTLEANVLTPHGEQAGNSSGYVTIQYFVANAAAVYAKLTVEYDTGDGEGFRDAEQGTQIFSSQFTPGTTGDLRFFVWDAVADFPGAGAGAGADPVVLRFTFDPGTGADTSDDVIEEITFNLDNKPQALPSPPYAGPARKRLRIDASDSWVPGGGATISDFTWTFDSTAAGSTLTDADITKITSDPAHPLLAYFQPDVAGDYVLSLQVRAGGVSSDAALTTVHVLDPDNYVGAVEFGVIDLIYDPPGKRPVTPGNLALDATPGSETLIWHSRLPIEYVGDLLVRAMFGKMDVSTLPGTAPTMAEMGWTLSYSGQYGRTGVPMDISRPEHLDTYYNGTSVSVATTNLLITLNGIEPQGNVFLETVTVASSPPFDSVEQADIDPEDDLGVSNAYLRSARICQVPRGGQTIHYWLVNAYDNVTTGLISGWLVEAQADATSPYTPVFTAEQFPLETWAYDVEVQLGTFGSSGPTAFVSSVSPTTGSMIFYSELGSVGTLGALTPIDWYPANAASMDMILDETNGYLFVADNGGGTNFNGSIYVISLDSRAVVATLNLPGDYCVDELEIDLDTGTANTAMLFGTDPLDSDFRDMIHLIWVDYSAATPVLTCLPSIDTGPHPLDIIYEDARNVLFVSEPDNNSITVVQGAPTGSAWVADNAATAAAGDDQNAECAVDPTTGDLCVVFQRNAGAGIFFTKSSDGGNTWSTPALVSDNGSATVVQDPDIAVDRWGNIIVVWADDSAGDLDVYMRRSGDGGTTWEASSFAVNTDTDTNDQGGPCVAVDEMGNIIVAFESDDGAGSVAIELVKTVGLQGWTYFGPADSNISVVGSGAYQNTDPDILLTPNVPHLPDAWVVWSCAQGTTINIFANWADTTYGNDNASGMTFDFQSTPLTVASWTGNVSRARAAYDPDPDPGTPPIVIVWEQDKGNGEGIYLSGGSRTGFGADVVVEEPAAASSGTFHNPYISIQPYNGGRVIVYESDVKNVGGDTDVFWEIHRNYAQGWGGEGIRMNADTAGRQGRPLVHMYMGNACIVIWEDERDSGATGVDLYSNRQ